MGGWVGGRTCLVQAGDILFIPEGWWHQVDSESQTIALNYVCIELPFTHPPTHPLTHPPTHLLVLQWYDGFVETHLETGEGRGEAEEGGGEDMLPFYFRATLQKTIEQEKTRLLTEANQQATAGPSTHTPSYPPNHPPTHPPPSTACQAAIPTFNIEINDQGWRNLLKLALQPPTDPPLFNCILRVIPLPTMLSLLPPMFLNEEDGWVRENWARCFLQLSPVTVEALTRRWEEEEGEEGGGGKDAMAVFFETIFEGHEEAMKQHLFRQKEAFAQEACRKVVGLDCDSDCK